MRHSTRSFPSVCVTKGDLESLIALLVHSITLIHSGIHRRHSFRATPIKLLRSRRYNRPINKFSFNSSHRVNFEQPLFSYPPASKYEREIIKEKTFSFPRDLYFYTRDFNRMILSWKRDSIRQFSFKKRVSSRYASIRVYQSFYEIRETIVFRGSGTYNLQPVTIPLLSVNRIVAFAKTRQHCWELDELALQHLLISNVWITSSEAVSRLIST